MKIIFHINLNRYLFSDVMLGAQAFNMAAKMADIHRVHATKAFAITIWLKCKYKLLLTRGRDIICSHENELLKPSFLNLRFYSKRQTALLSAELPDL